MDSEEGANALALKAKSTGDSCYRSGHYSKAFAHYLLALNIRSDWLEGLKDAFIHSLTEWGNYLEKEDRSSDLLTCYEEALKIYPLSAVILNNFGALLLRLKHVKEACRYFRDCLDIDPLYLPARRNLENVSNLLVERWHFRMLNDRNRNECYRRAIQSLVGENDTVLDIGTGTGILSLFAAENKPKMIYACDYSEVMSTIASDIVEKNGFSHKIKIINKSSDELIIPSDLRERVSLVITEVVDAGLFGEGILQSVDDAWNRLLIPSLNSTKQNIIPKSAAVFIVPVESLSLARKYKFMKKENHFINVDVDLKVDLNEPYDSENLKSIEFKYLSEPYEIFNIDFNDRHDVKEHLYGKRNTLITIDCNDNGRLDAFVVYFNLNLSKNETISTSPVSTLDTCWEQAIFPIFQSIDVTNRTKIDLKLSASDGKLTLDEYKLIGLGEIEKTQFKVSKDLIKFFNSRSSLKQYNIFVNKLLQTNVQSFDVLELTIYPYAGFKLLENGRGKVSIFNSNDVDVEFLKSKAQEYDSQLCDFHQMDSLERYLKGGRKFDVVVMELFNSDGELDEKLMNIYPTIRKSMKENSIIFPNLVQVHCQLVYSEWLENYCKLNNSSLLSGYKGFDTLNDFKINNFIDLDIDKLKYVKMSEELILGRFNIDEIFSDLLRELSVTTEALQDGPINAILYWFSYGDESAVITTRSEDSYRNQSAEILNLPLSVTEEDSVNVKLNYMSCIFKFYVDIIT